MSDNKLISALVSDLSPVQVKKPIRTTVVSFGIVIIGTLFIFNAFLPVRSDLQQMMTNSIFLFSTFAALLICLLGFFTAIFLSTPGRASKHFVMVLYGSMAGLIGILLVSPNQDPQAGMATAQSCTFSAMALGALSLVVFFFAAKKMAPLHPGLIGALCGVGATCVGMTAIAFHCASENPLHLMIWHLSLPLVGFSLIGYLVGRKFLRW